MVGGTPVNTAELTLLQRHTRLSIFLSFFPLFFSAELWPYVLIMGEQISSTNAQIETQSLLRTQRASNAYKCENLLGLFQFLVERIENLQGQEAARCHECSAGVFVLSEQAISKDARSRLICDSVPSEATN